jgi:hypothetical protein
VVVEGLLTAGAVDSGRLPTKFITKTPFKWAISAPGGIFIPP